jgi:dTDP-4-amino-4,6-dideoxy-D-galactose acyltransferase
MSSERTAKLAPETRASGPCELLQWDTSFWGFPVARVRGDTLTLERATEIDAWCLEAEVSCLYFLAALNDPLTTESAESAGFHLTDVRLTFRCRANGLDLPQEYEVGGAFVIRESRPEDVATLQRIAGTSHRQTRFYSDRRFPREQCRLLYETWIRRSCEGYADMVFVAADEEPVGYVTCHLPGGGRSAGGIGLVGVVDRAQGRGIGRALVQRALHWFTTAGAPEVTVVTQGVNYAAQVLYQRCGFVTQSAGLWYHKWYSLPATRGSSAC